MKRRLELTAEIAPLIKRVSMKKSLNIESNVFDEMFMRILKKCLWRPN